MFKNYVTIRKCKTHLVKKVSLLFKNVKIIEASMSVEEHIDLTTREKNPGSLRTPGIS